MHRKSFSVSALVLLTAVVALPVQAELYKWTDAEGRVHFTDKKPESAASKKVETLATPRASAPGGRSVEETPAAGSTASDVLQRQKRMADILAQEREQHEQEVASKNMALAARKRKCLELRDYRRNAEGSRLYDVNDKGERVYMGDKEHSGHLKELDQAIQEACQ